MENSKFYYSGLQTAILKRLVYKIECLQTYTSNGDVSAYAIDFYLFHQDQVITWIFEDKDMRDRVYGNVLDASRNQ